MSTIALYPPAPSNVPAEVTRLDSGYRGRVIAMIVSLFLFLILYLIFVAAAGLLAYWLLLLPIPDIKGRGIFIYFVFKFGGAFAAVLLWLFLFKGLFKGQRVDRSQYVPLNETERPELFRFIRQICQDTGAPLPRRVYVSPEVNAALVYNTSLLSLFIPPKKDLLIGLGLVNVVKLSEFKAVVAHEFGHFAQRSVGLGSYLYVANRVMHDVVYSRDGLDRFVDQWSQIDLRISFPAWALKGVLWVVRKILGGVFQGLNLLHLSLSRQMEFNADNVAVSVAGSDAIVHALARLDFASECLTDAAHSLNAAADHGLFTDDLFYHQTQSSTRLRRLRKDERLGLPPELPDNPQVQVQVFQPEYDGIPESYRSHPTNHMREANAKRLYLRSPQDDRSPWLLFGDTAGLKREVTERFYRHGLDRREVNEPRPATEVQQFLDAEHAETTFDPRYHGLYDDRFINAGALDELKEQPWPREQVAAFFQVWPDGDLKEKVETFNKRRGEFEVLRGLNSGELTLKSKTFTFREQERTAKEVPKLFEQVNAELDADIAAFHDFDRRVFLAHWSLATLLDGGTDGGPRAAELFERYRFHMDLQATLQGLLNEQGRLQSLLNYLSGAHELSPEDFQGIRSALQEIRDTLTASLDAAEMRRTPSMTNVPAGTPLYTLIADRGDTVLPPLSSEISGEWLGKLAMRIEGVLSRVKRLHFKSLGSLLAFQAKLATELQGAERSELPAAAMASAVSQ